MKLVTTEFKLGGLHEKHVVATWNLGNHLSICFLAQGNKEKPVSRWLVAGLSEYWLPAINIISINQNWCVTLNFKPSWFTWTLLTAYSTAKLTRCKTNNNCNLMFIGPCITVIVEEWKTNLMSLAILFQFLCAQHVSDINISIFRSLWLCRWITTSVVLFSVRCVLEIWCGWVWVVLILQAEAQPVCIKIIPAVQPANWCLEGVTWRQSVIRLNRL